MKLLICVMKAFIVSEMGKHSKYSTTIMQRDIKQKARVSQSGSGLYAIDDMMCLPLYLLRGWQGTSGIKLYGIKYE